MAIITGIAAGNMVCNLAGSGTAIMTTETATRRYTTVIKCRGAPGRGIVAVITGVSTLNMPRRLAGGFPPVMATTATTGHHIMIHPAQRRPQLRCMAFLA